MSNIQRNINAAIGSTAIAGSLRKYAGQAQEINKQVKNVAAGQNKLREAVNSLKTPENYMKLGELEQSIANDPQLSDLAAALDGAFSSQKADEAANRVEQTISTRRALRQASEAKRQELADLQQQSGVIIPEANVQPGGQFIVPNTMEVKKRD